MESDRTRAKKFRLLLLKRSQPRREGSLAAAIAQSMALAMISTAGAYPSWVLVSNKRVQVVLGASWAITRKEPAPDSPLLGPAGPPLMLAIAFCCLAGVMSGLLALTLDFLGRRRHRALAPVCHCLTALLMTCAAALGSCLLTMVRGRTRTVAALKPFSLSASPGQSLFLAGLACALAATATGLSCTSPAQAQPQRSSWDLGRNVRRSRSEGDEDDDGDQAGETSGATLKNITWLNEESLPEEDTRVAGGRWGWGWRWLDYLRREPARQAAATENAQT